MFEGKHPFVGESGHAGLGVGGAADPARSPSQALVRMEWDALVARLGAARELRGALASHAPATSGADAADASFDARSARRLHALADGKLALNHKISADGNAIRRTVRTSDAAAPQGSAQTGDPRK